jgi:hypothetical protein
VLGDELCLEISDIATESRHIDSLRVRISCRHSPDSLIGDISTYVLVWELCRILTVGTEDESAITTIFLVESEYCMSCRARSSKEIENEGIRVR